LNASTKISTVLQFADCFSQDGQENVYTGRHYLESFLQGKTVSSIGNGQRNQSYMFKEGAICGEDIKICGCVKYQDANEQDYDGDISGFYEGVYTSMRAHVTAMELS